METKQVVAGELKPGRFVVFDGIACKVTKIDVSRTGKHGHAKCRIEAVGLIDDRKIVKIMPSHDKVWVPIIEKKTAQILSVSENTANVMDTESYETFDLKIPDDLKDQVQEGKQVLYWIILKDKVMVQVK